MKTTETLDKAYLEYSQITSARTEREIELEEKVRELQQQRKATESMREACIVLRRALEDSSMELSNFSLLWASDSDPLPKNENEVTEFIKKRTRLWRESWIRCPIKQALEFLGNLP